MTHDRFSFEGLTAIEQRLVRLADEVDYIVVQDLIGWQKDETLGHFDFNAHGALPYLEDEHDDPSEGDQSPFDDTWDDQPEDDGPAITRKQIAEAACRWIRDIAQRCCIGERYIRFRIKAWGPKAFRMVDSGQFVCHNHSFDLDLPVGADEPVGPPMPEPDFAKAALRSAANGIQAPGEYCARWGNMCSAASASSRASTTRCRSGRTASSRRAATRSTRSSHRSSTTASRRPPRPRTGKPRSATATFAQFLPGTPSTRSAMPRRPC